MPSSSPASDARSRLAKVSARYASAGSESSLRTRFKLLAASKTAARRVLRACKQGRAGLVIAAAESWRIRWLRIRHGLVEDLDVGQAARAARPTPAPRRRPPRRGGRSAARPAAFWPRRGAESPLTQGQPPSSFCAAIDRRPGPGCARSAAAASGARRGAGRPQVLQAPTSPPAGRRRGRPSCTAADSRSAGLRSELELRRTG